MDMKRMISTILVMAMLLLSFGVAEEAPQFRSLDDKELLYYVENEIYADLIDNLDENEYYVEDIRAVYISQDYIDELEYNTRANKYFGYTIAELNDLFQDDRYVFTLGEDGQTTVQAFEAYYDDNTLNTIIRNVAIGTGVILVCVTVSVVTAGTGATAVSMIFAMAAKTGTVMAVQGAAFGGVSAGIVELCKTGNVNEALEASAIGASEGFKWGAISGAVTGGTKEAIGLSKATLRGLSMNDAASIQKQTKWPLDAIKNLHSVEEANIYRTANLVPYQLEDGSWAFLREIDWSLTDDFGRTNVDRVLQKLAPIDATGSPYELHHIGMNSDSPLAILTKAEHHAKGSYSFLHWAEEGKDISASEWAAQKAEFWKAILKIAGVN